MEPPSEFAVVPWYELADAYNKTVSLFSKQVEVVRVIIAAIIVLSITNTMMMSVMERTGEIGMSMALGVTRRGILALFVSEGLWLGVFGLYTQRFRKLAIPFNFGGRDGINIPRYCR